MKIYTAFLLYTLLFIFTISAQELKVTGFRAVPMDLSASTHMRRDANNTPCALVKVVLRAEGASFEGNIVGDTQFRTNEYWVYLTEGTKMLRVKHISARPLMIRFSDYDDETNGLLSKVTYEMEIQLPTVSTEKQTAATSVTDLDADRTYTNGLIHLLNEEYALAFENFLSISKHPGAQRQLGIMYYEGNGVKQDYKEAVRWYKKGAENGDLISINRLGESYLKGVGVETNYNEAARLFRQSAEQGHSIAQYNLALMYCDGKGVEKDLKEGVRWHHKAAEQGYIKSQNAMGISYKYGLGVEKDHMQAADWFKKAANKGYAPAQLNLGNMYRSGLGVYKHDATAIYWYRKAAEQGDEVAQVNLGHMYFEGSGVAKSHATAAGWYKKSAEQGERIGQYYLGFCLYNGYGLRKDKKEAHNWIKKSADQGFEPAIKFLSEHKF
ncbi:SEL1-like repeat protein [uncultured Muribaculum sp.]|uniref:SEL1-like repeat protein n=1 Tax=uncultured Muribaculum sp. TaxID=1918613 RepID=UPI0026772C38|nr:tetratricopeptide repeat protein [uncultured Muribaculum sp.]